MQLAASPEAFLTLRSHFVRTIASVSSCQYILGIGDRHLSNFMVDLESGGIVGIDFGHNFGTATQVMPHSVNYQSDATATIFCCLLCVATI